MQTIEPGSTWQATFDAELERAVAARMRGNEGQARVCARRAAGLVASEYLRRRFPGDVLGASAFDLLRRLASLSDLPAGTGEIITRFLIRVDTNHSLPPGIDLVADARTLVQALNLA